MDKVRERYGCACAPAFVLTVPVEGLKNQRCFDDLRTSYIKELDRVASRCGETTRTQRLFQLTQLLDSLQSVMDTIRLHIRENETSVSRRWCKVQRI